MPSLSSFVGAIPGALLPVMGWLAARNAMDLGGWFLFMILFLWQIPHALIIAIRHRDDYLKAGMRQLPVVASNVTATRQILLHIVILIPASLMPNVFYLADWFYAMSASVLGGWLFYRAVAYAITKNERQAKLFFVSLSAYLPLLLIAMLADKWIWNAMH